MSSGAVLMLLRLLGPYAFLSTLCWPSEVGRRVAFKAVWTSSRYVIVTSRKAILCDMLAHGYIGHI